MTPLDAAEPLCPFRHSPRSLAGNPLCCRRKSMGPPPVAAEDDDEEI